jgi:hypothetical protein
LSDEVVKESLNGDARIQDGAVFLDGNGDYIERPSGKEFSLSKGLTVAATIKLDSIKNHIIAGKVGEWLFGFNSDGRLYFNIKAEKGDWACDTKSAAKLVKEGELAHVAAIYRPNTDPLAAAKGRVEIYLNGIQVGSKEMHLDPEEGGEPMRIGRLWGDARQANTWDMKGEIRDLRLFNSALDASEIVSLACEQPGITVAPLIFEVVPDVTGDRLGIRAKPQLSNKARMELEKAVTKGKAALTVTVQAPKESGSAKKEARFTFDPKTATYWMPYKWSDGSHEVNLSLEGGSSVLTASRPVIKPPTPWIGKGKAPTEVMKPWTPLATSDGRSVECWGRRYLFDGSGWQGKGATHRNRSRHGGGDSCSRRVQRRCHIPRDQRSQGLVDHMDRIRWCHPHHGHAHANSQKCATRCAESFDSAASGHDEISLWRDGRASAQIPGSRKLSEQAHAS